MREIKFRAWDKSEKRTLYRGIFDRNWYATPYNDEGGCHCIKGILSEDRHWMKLMQYTGLKDKNGVEIYEGDIVKMVAEFYVDEEIGWKNFEYIGDVRIWASKGVIMRVRAQDSKKLWHSRYFYKNVRGYRSEVIGNIHENHELLENPDET
jgi:uncharacterized phage protein (TIGR01671 family)